MYKFKSIQAQSRGYFVFLASAPQTLVKERFFSREDARMTRLTPCEYIGSRCPASKMSVLLTVNTENRWRSKTPCELVHYSRFDHTPETFVTRETRAPASNPNTHPQKHPKEKRKVAATGEVSQAHRRTLSISTYPDPKKLNLRLVRDGPLPSRGNFLEAGRRQEPQSTSENKSDKHKSNAV